LAINFENCFDQTNILIVCDSPTIVNLCTKELQHLEWYLIILIKEHFELFNTNGEVFICKFVSYIPAYCAEFASVLYDGVEKAESEQQFFELLRFFAIIKLLVCKVVV
jgi:hypothetical protein